jgi:hypothetical protein
MSAAHKLFINSRSKKRLLGKFDSLVILTFINCKH